MTNLGKWDDWYKGLDPSAPSAFRYGDTTSYRTAAEFFFYDCDKVEDWGCGAGGFLLFWRKDRYRGIDGSHTPFADEIVDLTTYRSNVEGILLRHILEHNWEWQKILRNAIESATVKVCLIIFTPFSDDVTKVIADNTRHGVAVPDISFTRKDIEDILEEYGEWSLQIVKSDTGYGEEHVYRIYRT